MKKHPPHDPESILKLCDALLVIGTSAQVYPAGGFLSLVRSRGGTVFEFNLLSHGEENEAFSATAGGGLTEAHYFFEGKATVTVPRFIESVFSMNKSNYPTAPKIS